jgi:RHS repeat-associated protein
VTPEATTVFIYDDWNLIEERVAYVTGAASTIKYYWGKDLSGELQGAGGVGGLLYFTVDDAIYIPCYDNNGNVTKYVDANGGVVASYTYDAFGKLIAKFGPLADFFRHRFSTKYFDIENGLYHYGYRFYHPALMRWLNRDPIEENGGVNLYGFCGNNGVVKYDKFGLAHFEVRKLSGAPGIIPYSCFGAIIGLGPALALDLGLANKWNIEILHEHLFYDDGTNVGYGETGKFKEDSKTGYRIKDPTNYHDCIMKEAEKLVKPPPYSLIGWGTPKYNCQDYADALRRKYDEIKDDPKVKCKCKKGESNVK